MMQALPTLSRARWLVALLLCAALAACGGDDTPGTLDKPGAAPNTPEAPGKTPETKPQLRCAP